MEVVEKWNTEREDLKCDWGKVMKSLVINRILQLILNFTGNGGNQE